MSSTAALFIWTSSQTFSKSLLQYWSRLFAIRLFIATNVRTYYYISVYTASAVPVPEDVLEHEYPRYVSFPDSDGVMHVVDLEEQPDIELLNEIQRNPANNLYLLFTR